MSKVIGATVGTPLSPKIIKEKLKKDGFYPTISVSDIEDGYRITITDTNGTQTVDVRDGKDGYTPVKNVDYVDGEDGYTPIKGVDYFDGKDGYTPKKGVDYFDGKDGDDGYTPVKGKDYFDGKDGYTPVKGKDYFDGEPGKTPVKGTDYYTEADKAEMVSAVIAALPKYDGEVVAV